MALQENVTLRPNEPLQVMSPDGKWQWTKYCLQLFQQFQAGVTGLVDLDTDVTGDLPIANGGTGNVTANASFAALSPMTTRGDLITRSATVPVRLGIGANGTVLTSNGTDPGWVAPAAAGFVTTGVTLTANALALGAGTNAIGIMASLGTTTTVLHGNAAGAPTFGAVSLTADVSGTLPIGNGGTNGVTANAGFANLSPMTTRGDLITRDATVPVRLPIGAAGRVLTSDGTDASWQAPSTGTTTKLLTFSLSNAGSVLTTGYKTAIKVPFACTITSAILLSNDPASTVGDLELDVLVDPTFPPTTSVTASAQPTLSGDNESTDSTLTGWDTSIAANAFVGVEVLSVTDILQATLELVATV